MADKKKNIKNSEHSLFRRLTRIFSGPIVNYRKQTEHNLRRRKLIKYNFKSASGQQFKKTGYFPFESLKLDIIANQRRAERYADFEEMEFIPEINSALDLYSDEMTTSTHLEPLLSVKCPSGEIKDILDTLYMKILNVEHNLFQWCRSLCKYGDYFLYLDIDEDIGVRGVIGLPQIEIERLEGEDKTNPNYVQFQWNNGGVTFENWQIAHFRILGDDKYAPYGVSVLDGARRIHRQLVLLEDAMMAYRIVRAPERRVFKIDVGNIAPKDVEAYMQQVMTQMKRNMVVNPTTGKVDLRYNANSIDEDFYIPVRGANSQTTIEPLPGGSYVGDIDDVKYLRDKLFSALKVPQEYLARGEGSSGEESTALAQKDIRFARTIQRLQRCVVSELEKIGIIHLYTLGYRGEDLINFKLSLNNPSKLAELQDLEHWRTRFDVATAATEGFFSKRWIGEKIFNLSEEDLQRNQREMFYDAQLTNQLGGIEEAEGGLGGDMGDLGDDLEDEEELDLEEPIGGEEEGEDEDETLLAAPAKRDDKAYLTPRAKGKWYAPVKDDKRNMGARKRHLKSKYNYEKRGSSKRSKFPGVSGLASLSKGITLSEDKEKKEDKNSIYKKEELKLERQNREIRELIENLNNLENGGLEKKKKIILKEEKTVLRGNKNET